MKATDSRTDAMLPVPTPAAPSSPALRAPLRVALLTGADDRSYALGLANSLLARGVYLDFIGSDTVDGPQLHGNPLVRFLNLRGDQSAAAPPLQKVLRLLRYYLRLAAYAARSRAGVLHILWNNKFQHFDRTLLMLYYRAFGHRVVLTAHNVNTAQRDGHDSALNRLTLRIQYHLCHHVFVHTEHMREQLCTQFCLPRGRVSVIPFGLNETTPTTPIDDRRARVRLGLDAQDHVLLFFGQIAPYKGLEHLVAALPQAVACDPRLKLVIAGKVKAGCEAYWRQIETTIAGSPWASRVHTAIRHIPDDEVELYFKSADVLTIPYVKVFQSGVPFLGYSFGLPVIATDVGALRDDILEGRTGLICRPCDSADIARAIGDFFAGPMHAQSAATRASIRDLMRERHSWATVAAISESAYSRVRGAR